MYELVFLIYIYIARAPRMDGHGWLTVEHSKIRGERGRIYSVAMYMAPCLNLCCCRKKLKRLEFLVMARATFMMTSSIVWLKRSQYAGTIKTGWPKQRKCQFSGA